MAAMPRPAKSASLAPAVTPATAATSASAVASTSPAGPAVAATAPTVSAVSSPAVPATALSLRQVLARNIRLARVHQGLSQERMAAAAELDRTFIGTLERGVRNISVDNIERLAKVLDMAPHELLDPTLPERRGYDLTATRAPRSARLYPVPRARKD